jgi:hypothetical protein
VGRADFLPQPDRDFFQSLRRFRFRQLLLFFAGEQNQKRVEIPF